VYAQPGVRGGERFQIMRRNKVPSSECEIAVNTFQVSDQERFIMQSRTCDLLVIGAGAVRAARSGNAAVREILRCGRVSHPDVLAWSLD